MEFSAVVDFIGRNRKFLITAHETPDGDAIGSECAMLAALRAMGRKAAIVNADPTPRKFSYLAGSGEITVLQEASQLPADLSEHALLILDTNDTRNIGQVADLVLPRVREHFIIDHHESDEDIAAGNLIQKNASSTAEILYRLLQEMKVPVGFDMAQSLFTAIVYDTGSFIYPKTTALTFSIAHDLLETGVKPNLVYTHLYESNSIAALVLQSKVMSTLELAHGNHVAIQTMRRQMILDSGAIYEESDQLINIPLKSEDVRVSVFFKENTEGLMRCSIRSKGNIDVAAIAQHFGGGGHRTAAGFKCSRSLEETREIVLAQLAGYFA